MEEEWSDLGESVKDWQARLEKCLSDMRNFERDLSSVEKKLTEMEDAHETWNKLSSSDDVDEQEHLQRLSTQVSSLEKSVKAMRDQAERLSPSLSPATVIQLDRVETRFKFLRDEIERQMRESLTPASASDSSMLTARALPSKGPLQEGNL